MRIALYPGTFDPVTNGHLSLIRRGCQVFDHVIVAVADRTPKPPLFTQDERVDMICEALGTQKNIEVVPFSGLTIGYAAERRACAILRGMRAVSDFESEFQLALMNRRLRRNIQTVFFMTDYRWLYVSSSIIKAAISHGGSIDGLVPELVRDTMLDLYRRGRLHHSTPCLGTPIQGYAREPEPGEPAPVPQDAAGPSHHTKPQSA